MQARLTPPTAELDAPATSAPPTASARSGLSSARPGSTIAAADGEQAGHAVVRRIAQAEALEAAEERARAALLSVEHHDALGLQAGAFVARLAAAGADPSTDEGRLRRSRATEVFLRMDTTQERLAAMTDEDRRAALADIRAQFGYGPEAIARLAATDRYKDARWTNGLAYMQERAQLERRLPEGEAFEAALIALRQRFFDHEAQTIAREEASGFFRYQRRRVFGRN